MLEPLFQVDRWLFHLLNQQWTNPVFDELFPFLRNQFFWVPVYFFLLSFVGLNFKKQVFWWAAFLLATFAFTDLVSTQVFKAFVHRPRPCWDPVTASTARMLIPCSTSYSFVSSHAANHFGLSTFVFLTFRHLQVRFLWLLFVWAGLVCYAQIYAGAHFPLDVLGGMLLGILTGMKAASVFQKQFGFLGSV
jgi:undecaprenyl-diphosphatase